MEKSKIRPTGLLIVFVLQIVFFLLDASGSVEWSWTVILSPLWVFGAIVVILSGLIYLLRALSSGGK